MPCTKKICPHAASATIKACKPVAPVTSPVKKFPSRTQPKKHPPRLPPCTSEIPPIPAGVVTNSASYSTSNARAVTPSCQSKPVLPTAIAPSATGLPPWTLLRLWKALPQKHPRLKLQNRCRQNRRSTSSAWAATNECMYVCSPGPHRLRQLPHSIGKAHKIAI